MVAPQLSVARVGKFLSPFLNLGSKTKKLTCLTANPWPETATRPRPPLRAPAAHPRTAPAAAQTSTNARARRTARAARRVASAVTRRPTAAPAASPASAPAAASTTPSAPTVCAGVVPTTRRAWGRRSATAARLADGAAARTRTAALAVSPALGTVRAAAGIRRRATSPLMVAVAPTARRVRALPSGIVVRRVASAEAQTPSAAPGVSPALGLARLPPTSVRMAPAVPTERSAQALLSATAAHPVGSVEVQLVTVAPVVSPDSAPAVAAAAAYRLMGRVARTARLARARALETVVLQRASAVLPIPIARQAARQVSARVTPAAATYRRTDLVPRMARPAKAQRLATAAPPVASVVPPTPTVELVAMQHSARAAMVAVMYRRMEAAPRTGKPVKVLRLVTAVLRAASVARPPPIVALDATQPLVHAAAVLGQSLPTVFVELRMARLVLGPGLETAVRALEAVAVQVFTVVKDGKLPWIMPLVYSGTGPLLTCKNSQKASSSACLTTNIPSNDGTCGSKVSLTCAGGSFNGQCCSSAGFCGTTSGHCGTGW